LSILLVRHATAGKRKRWHGDDRLRPLDDEGRAQAAELPTALGQFAIDRICSSPYVRCRQTVEPLALALDLEIEERDELTEGAGPDAPLALAFELGERTAVLCTHGDVIVDLVGEETEKGSTSVLELVDGRLVRREYLPPVSSP
jgi:phosphohistidine phosphatase SixA